jgi:hypothetical protein
MSRVQVRPTTQLGFIELSDGNTFGTYSTIFSATRDRFDWDEYMGTIDEKRSDSYPTIVSKKYHTSASYLASVSGVVVKGLRTAFTLLFAIVPMSYFLIKTILS